MNVDEYRALTERDLREPEPNPKVAAERLPEPNFHKQVMQDLDRMLLEPDPAQVRLDHIRMDRHA